jgi:hypothetical protein
MIRHLAVPDGIGACAKPDGILDAISRRNARSDYCCLRAARVFSFERAGQAADNYSIELRPDVESLVLPGVEVIDIEVRCRRSMPGCGSANDGDTLGVFGSVALPGRSG